MRRLDALAEFLREFRRVVGQAGQVLQVRRGRGQARREGVGLERVDGLGEKTDCERGCDQEIVLDGSSATRLTSGVFRRDRRVSTGGSGKMSRSAGRSDCDCVHHTDSIVTTRFKLPFSAIPKLANVLPYASSTPPNPSSTRKAIECFPYLSWIA